MSEEKQTRGNGAFKNSKRARDLLLSNIERTGNITQSAKLSGWAKSTVYDVARKDPVFADQIDEARVKFLKEMGKQFQGEAPRALDTLVLVMKDANSPATAKVSAADKILQYAVQFSELSHTEEGIAAITADLQAITGSFGKLQLGSDPTWDESATKND